MEGFGGQMVEILWIFPPRQVIRLVVPH